MERWLLLIKSTSAVAKEQNGDSSLLLTVKREVCGGVKAAPLTPFFTWLCVKVFKEIAESSCCYLHECKNFQTTQHRVIVETTDSVTQPVEYGNGDWTYCIFTN